MQIVAFGGEIIVCGRRGLPILEHSRVGRAYSDTRIPAEAFKRPIGDTRKAASQLPQIGPMATVQHSSLAAWPGPYQAVYIPNPRAVLVQRRLSMFPMIITSDNIFVFTP